VTIVGGACTPTFTFADSASGTPIANASAWKCGQSATQDPAQCKGVDAGSCTFVLNGLVDGGHTPNVDVTIRETGFAPYVLHDEHAGLGGCANVAVSPPVTVTLTPADAGH
jgi:hypothetical protein